MASVGYHACPSSNYLMTDRAMSRSHHCVSMIERDFYHIASLVRWISIDRAEFIRIVQHMRQMLILIVMLALFIVPVSTFADEDHVQIPDTTLSIQLADHESSDSDQPASDRGAEHCGHCVPMPLRPESLTIVQASDQTSTYLGLENLPRLMLVARAEKPPRH